MRYSTSIVAASLASTAFAGQLRHGHRHRAREANAAAEAEPEPTNYTWSDGQCFGTYGCLSKTGGAAAQASAPAQATQQVQAQAQTTAAAQATKTQAANPGGVVQSVASKATSAAGAVASSVSGGSVNVQSLISTLKVATAESDGTCSEGSSKANVMEVKSNLKEDMLWVCWTGSKGYSSSFVKTVAPVLIVGVPAGQSKTLSFDDTPAGGMGGACAPLHTGNTFSTNGQIFDNWVEATFNQWGTVDLTREANMNGPTPISISTSAGCTSDESNCSFKCTSPNGENNSGSCMTDYELGPCTGSGANKGQPNAQGIIKDGGCMIGDQKKMTVTVG